MKRFIAIILLMLLLAGCNSNEKAAAPIKPFEGDPCPFLTAGDWEGEDGNCTNTIRFGEDGSFSNYCACGEPLGFADVIEHFLYRAKDQAILLYDEDNMLQEVGKVFYVGAEYLVINLWDTVYYYRNTNTPMPKLSGNTKSFTGTVNQTLPYLWVSGYKDGKIMLAPYYFDKLSSSTGEKWTLPVAEDIYIQQIIEGEDNKFSISTCSVNDLGKEDTLSQGIVTFNQNGEVSSIFLCNTVSE